MFQDCLQRFTQPEHLGSAAKIKCSKCNSHQVSFISFSMEVKRENSCNFYVFPSIHAMNICSYQWEMKKSNVKYLSFHYYLNIIKFVLFFDVLSKLPNNKIEYKKKARRIWKQTAPSFKGLFCCLLKYLRIYRSQRSSWQCRSFPW